MHRHRGFILALALLASPALGGDASAWITYTSKEGGFTVDLPAQPNRTRSRSHQSSRGMVKILMVGCDTPNGSYLALRADGSTNVPRGTEEQFLDFQRDLFAEIFNGKVITEKKVRAQGVLGRDFTIRGRPEGVRGGVASIRVRQYLAGRTIFAVAVISPGDRELPEDAGRFLGSLVLGEAKTRASGTPEPELGGAQVNGWGLFIDPDRDCKVTPGDRDIAFEVPGTLHDLFFDGGPTNSPRVMREVVGDFALTVRVSGEFKPVGPSTNPKTVPYNGAGILVWSDSDNNIRFERYVFQRGGRYSTGIAFQEREGGYAGAEHNVPYREGDCYLRLERRGSRITGAASSDGRSWNSLKPVDTVWPDKLKVGLTAITTSSKPFVVRFEQFDLRSPDAAPAAPPPTLPPPSPPAGNGFVPPDPAPQWDNRPEAPELPGPPPAPFVDSSPSSAPAQAKSHGLAMMAVLLVVIGVVVLTIVAVIGAIIWLMPPATSRTNFRRRLRD